MKIAIRRVTVVLALVAGSVVIPAVPAEASTTVEVVGNRVVITVVIDAPGLKGATFRDQNGDKISGEQYWEKSAENRWNAAFKALPYKCWQIELNVEVTARRPDWTAKPGRHTVFYSRGRSGVVLKPKGDTTGPYRGSTDGAIGDLSPGGVAHEVGHLLGLGDDYDVVSENPRRTKPRPGREGTLMAQADTGIIDRALIDRLGRLIEEVKRGDLPQCWTGTMHSDTTREYGVGPGRCSDAWDTEVALAVDPSGVVEGRGTARLVSGPECAAIATTGPTAMVREYEIAGDLAGGEFMLRFSGVAPGDGGTVYGGSVISLLYARGTFRPPGPTIRVPVTAPGIAEASFVLKNAVPYPGEFDTSVSRNTIRLTCDSCGEQAVG